jgi:AcrR family transcriptional regulator
MPARPRAQLTDDEAIDAALAIADERGWDQVRLHLVAERLGVPLEAVGARFRDVDAVANAWFARARRALLAVPPRDLEGLAADARLAAVLGRWLDHLAPHRAAARQILGAKIYLSHPHHWVPLIFDLSRLVHDLLDAARVEGKGRLRQAQEVGLTAIVLATLADWLSDRSEGQAASRQRLRRRLAAAGRWARLLSR